MYTVRFSLNLAIEKTWKIENIYILHLYVAYIS